MASYTDHLHGSRVDSQALLQLCDLGRSNLANCKRLGSTTSDIMCLLGAMSNDEVRGLPTLELDVIRETRLDKLLVDIQKPDNHLTSVSHIALIQRLERRWRSRFKEDYFDMDKARQDELITTGRLRDVIFNKTATAAFNLWQPKGNEVLSEVEGNLQYEPGQYVHYWVVHMYSMDYC